jgi:hypothetical protein
MYTVLGFFNFIIFKCKARSVFGKSFIIKKIIKSPNLYEIYGKAINPEEQSGEISLMYFMEKILKYHTYTFPNIVLRNTENEICINVISKDELFEGDIVFYYEIGYNVYYATYWSRFTKLGRISKYSKRWLKKMVQKRDYYC